MRVNFLKFKIIYFIISAILILGSLACLIVFGLKPGIDFTGGSILEIEYKGQRPDNQEIIKNLEELDLGDFHPQPAGEKNVILRMKEITEETHQQIIKKLKEQGELEEMRFEAVGPVIGRELKEKTKVVVFFSLLAIVIYIAVSFRRVSWPVRSWQYSLVSLVALTHDAIIPLGVFSLLGNFYGVQVSIPVVVAILTVLGYSINNTVVVFDRIRENLLRREGSNYEETVNISLNQTLTRSLNTSFTTLLVLAAIFFWGGETLKYFSLALILGITAGTWSSFFLAGPLLVSWQRFDKNRRK